MVTHSSTSRPVQCLCMAERTGCPVFTDLWSYVLSCNIALYSKPCDCDSIEGRKTALGLTIWSGLQAACQYKLSCTSRHQRAIHGDVRLSQLCIRGRCEQSILKLNGISATRGSSGTHAKPYLRPANLTTNHLQYLHNFRPFLQWSRIGHAPMILE